MPRRQALRAVPDQPQRAVLYRRVSALMGRGGDDFHSPALQLEAMRRTITPLGLREVGVVDDIDVSGQTFSRNGIDKIRAMVEAGEVEVVALYDLSRLGRDLADSLTFIKWLRGHGVSVVSSQERIDDSPEGQFMLGQFLGLAQLYGKQIGRRWAEVINRRARDGHHHGRPYGYRKVNKVLMPDPVAAPIVTWAWVAYGRGMPIGELTREVARRRGKTISTANVKVWFRNPAYLGHATVDGEIVCRDAHPPLVDQDTWDAVHLRLIRDSTTPPRHLEPTWSMVGLAHCPSCKFRLQRQPTRNRGEPIDRLICGMGPSRGVAAGCVGIGFPRLDLVEAEVLRQVTEYLRLLRSDDAARASRMARRAQAGADRSDLERELTRTRAGIAKLSKAWVLGDVPDSGYHGPMAQLRAAEVALSGQLANLAEPVLYVTPEEAANLAEAVLSLWPQATVAERGRLLRTVVRRVEVRRAARWREPEAERVTVEFV